MEKVYFRHVWIFWDELDLLSDIQKCDFQIKSGASFLFNDKICQFEFKDQFTKGWAYTYQVKRAEFDFELVKSVQKKGVEILFNTEVINIETSKDIQNITYLDKEGEKHQINSRFIIDASGYGRVIPTLLKLEKKNLGTDRSAIFSHLTDTEKVGKEGNNILIHSFNKNKAWIWSIPFSDNTASVGIVGNTDFIKECNRNKAEKFKQIIQQSPVLGKRFANAELKFEPKVILNYSKSSSKLYGEGYVLCGNATEFLDPIFSSGVTLAMVSGKKAAELVLNHLNGIDVNWEDEYSKVLNHGIDVFRSYVNAWYSGELHDIFFTENILPEFKDQICSVLAGYVWDTTNPFVKKHKKIIQTLSKVIKLNQEKLNPA